MSKEINYGANMRLITTYWGQNKTFKLMPITKECPYMEVLYDPSVQMLVALTKDQKQNYEMLPSLDADGEMIPAKKARISGKKFKEERRLMNVPQEFYLIDRAEQEEFIEKFAVNATDYDYKAYLDIKPADQSEIIQNHEAGAILDKDGKAMTVAK